MLDLSAINLIVVHPVGRGGSLLVHSLFDGHPSVITLPSLQYIYSRLDQAIADADSAIEKFIRQNPHVFDSSKGYFGIVGERVAGKFGPNGDQDLKVSIEEFRSRARALIGLNRQGSAPMCRVDFFKLVHVAYAECVRRSAEMGPVKFVFYHPHGTGEFELLLRDFPELYFIAMTRDPRQDWESWRKVLALRKECEISALTALDYLFSATGYSSSAFEAAKMGGRVKPGHFKALDLPKLHAMNKTAMLDLCRWLGMQFDDCLLVSTFNRQAWMGNAAGRTRSLGLDPKFRDKWRKSLSSEEIEFLSILNYGAISCWRYEQVRVVSAGDLDTLIGGWLQASPSREQTLFGVFIKYQLYVAKSTIIAFCSPLLPYDSLIRFLKQIAWKLLNLVQGLSGAAGAMARFSRFRDRELAAAFQALREQQHYLALHAAPDAAFLTSRPVDMEAAEKNGS